MSQNSSLIEAIRRAADLLGLPALLLKAFAAVEGANVNHRDGVLQVIPSTRAALIPRIPRALKLAALDLPSSATLSDTELNARFAQAFDAKNLLVQVVTGGYYIVEQLQRFGGYVALAGLAYNAGPARAQKEVKVWNNNPYIAARQYHKRIGSLLDEVTVLPGVEQVDPSTGVRWIRYPVIANDSRREIFQYLYLRQVPRRTYGLLDYIFRPTLLQTRGLYEPTDRAPAEDSPLSVLAVENRQLVVRRPPITVAFHTQPLSQRDAQWSAARLGFSTEGYTIGSHGCTLTCVTMMANGFGYQETPASLNAKLRSLGQNQGFFGALIAWYGVLRVLPALRLEKLISCRDVPAPMHVVDEALANGKPVIVELDISPSPGFQNHWVLIYGRESDDYLIHDPWALPVEARATLTERYGFAGDPSRIITSIVIYNNPDFSPGGPGSAQPQREFVLVVRDTDDIRAMGGLALRDRPTAYGSQVLQRLPAGSELRPIESESSAKQKIGVFAQWIQVKTADGTEGWVAGWLVSGLEREVSPTPTPRTVAAPTRRVKGLIELSGADLESAVQSPLRERAFVRVKALPKGRRALVRASAQAKGAVIYKAKSRERFEALEKPSVIVRKLQKRGEWLKVRLPDQRVGYIATTNVEPAPNPVVPAVPRRRARAKSESQALGLRGAIAPIEPDALALLRVNAQLGLNLRREPRIAPDNIIKVLPFGTLLLLREPFANAAPKLGQPNQWAPVVTLDGVEGFVSAQYVVAIGEAPTSNQELIAQGVVIAAGELTLRASASANSPGVWRVTPGTPLRLLKPEDWGKLGKSDELVEVETLAFKRGFVPADQLRLPDLIDRRRKVEDAPLPFGICAWNYGVHDPFDRNLFSGSGKTGWVLITHRVTEGQGMDYSLWARQGYGVIARLNNDYGGSGTVPVPSRYDWFAAQCRRWVLNSRDCLVWVIGNEMNNPREWPNQNPASPGNNPADAITPESYAACFNKVRAAIKSVQPNAIVVPGAIDPFQGPHMSCLDYFRRMLNAITDLDGIALHCYTHGYTPDLITSLATFQNDPLKWQYYHFRSYLTFLDVIPPRHRHKPIYITETNPHGPMPWSGGQNGWVQAAYAEIARHNAQPYAQQIQALILYRWSRDDRYSIVDKPDVQADIRATIASTDYRWRA